MKITRIFQLLEGNLIEDRIQNTLQNIIKNSKTEKIVKLNFFIGFDKQDEFSNISDEIRNIVKMIFNKEIPALTFISQDNFSNDDIIIECQSINKSDKKINYKTLLNHHYVTITDEESTEIISGGIQFNENSLLMASQRAFDFAEQILMAEDMNFGHIYRQWNYIPNILASSKFDGDSVQNFMIFNQIKELFYEKPLFKNGFPTTSNISCNFGGTTIDFIAVNSSNKHTYPIDDAIHQNMSPLESESNATLIESHNDKTIWFSGIKDDSKHNDIEKQTMKCFHNLFNIIDNKNLKENGVDNLLNQNFKDNFNTLRVYIKKEKDFIKASNIINDVLPNIPCIFIKAENIYKESLIEIEGTSTIISDI